MARATAVAGSPGGTLEVWPAGHYRGDLGEARLNQRAALYAEAILEKAARPGAGLPAKQRKSFDGLEGPVEVEFEFVVLMGAGA